MFRNKNLSKGFLIKSLLAIVIAMKFFRYSQDRLPVFFIVLLFLIDLSVFFSIDNIWLVALWTSISLVPKACICSWNHHHQHVPTFYHVFPNRMLELIYALQTGITTNAWVLHHVLGHHVNYLDQSKDESGWRRKDGKLMGAFEYTLTIALTGYTRAYRVGKLHSKHQKTFVSMGIVSSIVLAALFLINWRNALLIFFAPMFIGYILTCWHTYYHHAGLDSKEPTEASYNIMHKWYNILTGNLGYHTAHHMKMGLHWSKLPEYHNQIADQIPKDLYREPSIPFKWLPG